MQLIDGHMHATGYPKGWFKACADARGYGAYAVLSLSCTASYDKGNNNLYCLEAKREDPARCYLFAGLEHPCSDYLAHVQN